MRTHNDFEPQDNEFSFRQVKVTEVHENWIELKEKLIKKFGLSYDDLAFKDGRKDEMLTKLRISLGFSKEEFRAIISSL